MIDEASIITRESELATYAGPDRVVHFLEYLENKSGENKKIRTFKSGYSSFDEKLGGIATGEVTVLTGRTGEGKTLFAESLLHRLMKQDQTLNACLFTFENSASAMLQKYTNDTNLKLYVPRELVAMNIDWLVTRVLEAKIKFNCKVFVFDHLHYLVDMAIKQNMSLNIGAFMRRLKLEIAAQLNVAVILIAHQDKGEKKDEASLEGIRDSTFIAQEADNVIVISRRKDFLPGEILKMDHNSAAKIMARTPDLPDVKDEFKGQFATVVIAKARRVGTFRWPKLFQKVDHWFEEV